VTRAVIIIAATAFGVAMGTLILIALGPAPKTWLLLPAFRLRGGRVKRRPRGKA
jgi:hypothetical protein